MPGPGLAKGPFAGNVISTDLWLAAMRNGQAFGRQLSLAATNNPHVQLKNPTASGKIVIVHSLQGFSTSVDTTILAGIGNTNLTTLVGVGINLDVANANASVAQCRTQDVATATITSPLYVDRSVALPLLGFAGTLSQLNNFRDFMVLGAGEGFEIVGVATNYTLAVALQWIEIDG